MSAIRHLVWADEMAEARDAGEKVRSLCGIMRDPIWAPEGPECKRCESIRAKRHPAVNIRQRDVVSYSFGHAAIYTWINPEPSNSSTEEA